MLTSYLTGLLVCGDIIIAIGAQNAYILGQAIRRVHHWYCAGICMTADILLFTAGMFGVNAALMAVPEALDVMRWLGVAFLSWLALLAFARAAKGRDALDARKADVSSLRTVLFIQHIKYKFSLLMKTDHLVPKHFQFTWVTLECFLLV